MQGRNTVEEVLCLSSQRAYTVFHRNREESNVLSDIVVAHPTSIAMIKTVWTSQVFHFGIETANRTKREHFVLKLWLSTCHSDLDTVFLNIDSLIQGQIAEIKYTLQISKLKKKYGKSHSLPCACELVHRCQYLIPIREEDVDIFWRKLEIGYDILEEHDRDMDFEMRDLTSLIHEISIGPISKVREVRRLIKGVISPVLPEDSCQPLTTPPETAVTKGRRKTNSVKRDKSHWEYVFIAHMKIRKSSDSGSGPSPRGRGRPPRNGRNRDRDVTAKNVVGEGNCGFRIVSNFLFGDENHWVEIRRRMCFNLHHRMNVYVQLFGSVECVTELIRKMNWEEGSMPADYWMDTPDQLYVIANTFNLYVVFLARLGSTTVLPLVSNMDGNARTIFIGFIEEQEHFIQLHLQDGCPLPSLLVQWEYYRDVRVSGWAVPYRNWILDWVTGYPEMYPP
ncbi:hypothetical protein M9H77_21042 [Catharanthus roseus]|uniref:Uncharacterized protein n=1 Tax=Catharanthus roseus TaxID=4058 RepID=A0ACC0ALL6_CATRO|nr:hypothetical protein M9H77_21042 [Catharanthus roseus]